MRLQVLLVIGFASLAAHGDTYRVGHGGKALAHPTASSPYLRPFIMALDLTPGEPPIPEIETRESSAPSWRHAPIWDVQRVRVHRKDGTTLGLSDCLESPKVGFMGRSEVRQWNLCWRVKKDGKILQTGRIALGHHLSEHLNNVLVENGRLYVLSNVCTYRPDTWQNTRRSLSAFFSGRVTSENTYTEACSQAAVIELDLAHPDRSTMPIRYFSVPSSAGPNGTKLSLERGRLLVQSSGLLE